MSETPFENPQLATETDDAITSYWDRTQWPLQSLLFLLPLLVLHEFGTAFYAPEGNERLPPILAHSLLARFFDLFGVTGYYLPGLLVIGVLLAWHCVRRDPWEVEFKLYAAMFLESFILAVPLFVFCIVLIQQLSGIEPLAATNDPTAGMSLPAKLVLSIGAGIFEELVFRLMGIALIHFLLVDLLALPNRWGGALAVFGTSIAFAMYHFSEYNPFDWTTFIFYTLAGCYLAGIYLVRGFGIAAATHALYDVMVFTVPLLQGGG